ncbi:hypothetical protein [Kribbella deserti]|uniref:Uncharacterized protein n=1 Tax=Kribbella deserti TaxID=1926257 RepID=A0ABV6QSM3_9ACTN
MPAAREDRPDSEIPAHVRRFCAEFGIPAEYEPLGAIAIGYRADGAKPQNPNLVARRRSPEQLVHGGRWGRPFFEEQA